MGGRKRGAPRIPGSDAAGGRLVQIGRGWQTLFRPEGRWGVWAGRIQDRCVWPALLQLCQPVACIPEAHGNRAEHISGGRSHHAHCGGLQWATQAGMVQAIAVDGIQCFEPEFLMLHIQLAVRIIFPIMRHLYHSAASKSP